MPKPKVIVVRTAGTNCDKEAQYAFEYAGADAQLVHMNELIGGMKKLADYDIFVLPGGFTYGDDLGAGKIFANELRFKLKSDVERFIGDGKLIIGICNGFQILVKAGLLPGFTAFNQEASLILNDSAKFEDRWTYLKTSGTHNGNSRCVWTKDLPDVVYFPVAHGEGKFIVDNPAILERIKKNNQIVFQYCNRAGEPSDYPENPNGSLENIAGICDETGRILGLMPHPERHIFYFQHPHWTRLTKRDHGDGVLLFRNGVDYAKKSL